MTTHITLEDGRVLLISNGVFDGVLESAAKQLDSRAGDVGGLGDWLLDQRCEVQGPGVGYLDLRELSPQARSEFKSACVSAYRAMDDRATANRWLSDTFTLLINMWASIEKGEPPEAITSPHSLIAPFSGEQRGPGWK